ncbi:hypothetical protein SBOR_3609 [Sclerotinia borealis F-4128]|uniref:Uncharacterized protein n=1 Tax=Sclerotinia borealis (strain F-4128) TaxID=1432307 RepID=W9CMV8_SCLBF|nr:hypothetical protein SBOR_3609 [Sclerotinia borealis F-4128]
MEPKEQLPPNGSQTGTPSKTTTSPNSSKENSVGRLTRQSSIRTPIERALPLRMTSEEFEAFSQQVGNISLEEAKDHLQNLGPVPTLPDPVEMSNRKLIEKEENKTIRRDSISFLKRRTSERKTNLGTPNLTITTESVRTPPATSTAPPDSSTSVDMAPPVLRSSSPANTAASPRTPQSNGVQINQARGEPLTMHSGLVGTSGPASSVQQSSTSQAQGNGRLTHNILPSSTGPATLAFPPRVPSMTQPLVSQSQGVHGWTAPAATTGWVSDPYAENNGTPPASAGTRAQGLSSWQNQGASLPIPPVVPSQNQPVTLEWLYAAPIRSPIASTANSRETTPDLVWSSEGSPEFEPGKRKAKISNVSEELEHKKLKHDDDDDDDDDEGADREANHDADHGANSSSPQQ